MIDVAQLSRDLGTGAAADLYPNVSAKALVSAYETLAKDLPIIVDAVGTQGNWSPEVPRASNLLLCLDRYEGQRTADIVFGCSLLMGRLVNYANRTLDPRVAELAFKAIGYATHLSMYTEKPTAWLWEAWSGDMLIYGVGPMYGGFD